MTERKGDDDFNDDVQTKLKCKSKTNLNAKSMKRKEKSSHTVNKKHKVDSDSTNYAVNENHLSVCDTHVLEELEIFHNSLKFSIQRCSVCFEAWPIAERKVKCSEYICYRCSRDKRKIYGKGNLMIPCAVAEELKGLTQCEEMLIARAFPIMQVHVKPGLGYFGYKGHTITLPHNVKKIATVLPNLPDELPIVTFTAQKKIQFKIRRNVVLKALYWLIANNPLYKDITISQERLASLPLDGFIEPDSFQLSESHFSADEGNIDNDASKEHIQCSSFIPTAPCQKKETDKLMEGVQVEQTQIELGSEGFNEFSTQGLATMAFPCLFPDGNADPTNNATVYSVADNDTDSFAQKLKHLVKFGEFIDNSWIYRFAAHPRFGYWAYNMLFRHRLLKQGNFYINQP